jgi:glucokinase
MPRKTKSTRQSTSKRAKFTVGIDLGGTKAAAALVDSQGKIIAEVFRPTVPDRLKTMDPRASHKAPIGAMVKEHIAYVVGAMAEAVVGLLKDKNLHPSEIHGIGLASAGPMNIEKGTLDYPSNFLGWKVVPLVDLLKKRLAKDGIRLPVSFQNDAIAAALGEGWVGSARGDETYAIITVGTGIGTGVIFNGRPAQSRGMGSEWGHMMVDCRGSRTADSDALYVRTVEGLASGTGLIRRARARGFVGETASDLAQAASAGDAMALELFAEASEALASLMYSLSIGFHPERFVFSGGMLAIKEMYLPQAKELYKRMMQDYPDFAAPITTAKLGTRAGVIGAARLPYLI